MSRLQRVRRISERHYVLAQALSLSLNPSNLRVLYHSGEGLCRNNSEVLPDLFTPRRRRLLSHNFGASLIKKNVLKK